MVKYDHEKASQFLIGKVEQVPITLPEGIHPPTLYKSQFLIGKV